MDKTYSQPVRQLKLHDELIAAGITPSLVQVPREPGPIYTAVHIIAPQSEAAVDAVVAAHDPNTPSVIEQRDTADADALTAFRLGWLLGQARLGQIQNQCDTIEALTNAQALTGANVKTLAEAVEDLARQLQTLKRTVAIQAAVEER